jgi:DNA-binding transcriptional regulator YdaS (Cro superfamily)
MTLPEFFATQPRGPKARIARACKISKTWMSVITSQRRTVGAQLAAMIEKETNGAVKKADLRPDLWGKK